MMIIVTILALLLSLLALAYWRISGGTTSLLLVGVLIIINLFGTLPFGLLLVLLPSLVLLNVPSLRQRYCTASLLKRFQQVMPSLSATEKEAIEAGTTWWEGELFTGQPDWQKFHHYPAPVLTQEEQTFLDGPVEILCQMVNDWEITHERADLTPQIWQYLKEQRFFAMIIEKQYGGLGFSAYAQSCVLQKLCGASAVLASTVGVPNSLGPGELLQHYGTEQQKQHYLPRLARGQEIPCFALTSPEAGSDAGAIPDNGIVCYGQWQGREILGMKLTWNKRYITLAPIATVLGLAFKLRDPNHLLGDKTELGITCALIPTQTAGVIIGRRHFPLNVPFQNGPTQGHEVFVPLDFIIGGPAMAGHGWRMLVECLSVGRGITLPSNSTGGIKVLALATGAYSRIRRQFKMPIGKMEGIEEPLARIGANAYLMGAAVNFTVSAIDSGEKPAIVSAIVKYQLTQRSQKSIIDAMDIHGGKAICMGPSNYLARAYQGAPIAITVEGANILTRNMIIYGQGAIRCHPYILTEMMAAAPSHEDLALFDKTLFAHLGYAIHNLVNSLWLGLSAGRFNDTPKQDETARYYRQINRLSANLAFLSDLTMLTLGGKLKRKERLTARLGDILSQLYLASAVLKRYQDEGRQRSDLPLVHWALQDCLAQGQSAIVKLLANYPYRGLAKLFSLLLLPTGRNMRGPSDELDHQVAQLLQTPSATRSRLASGQYLTRIDSNPFGLLEQALDDLLAAEPLYERLCQSDGLQRPFMALDKMADEGLAKQLFTEQEAQCLRQAEISRLRTIQVDDFAASQLAATASN